MRSLFLLLLLGLGLAQLVRSPQVALRRRTGGQIGAACSSTAPCAVGACVSGHCAYYAPGHFCGHDSQCVVKCVTTSAGKKCSTYPSGMACSANPANLANSYCANNNCASGKCAPASLGGQCVNGGCAASLACSITATALSTASPVPGTCLKSYNAVCTTPPATGQCLSGACTGAHCAASGLGGFCAGGTGCAAGLVCSVTAPGMTGVCQSRS